MKQNLLFKLFAIVVFLPLQMWAQADIHFSQFYETSILRNPALTGVFAEDYKVGAIYRNQWSSISNPFQTGLVNAEARVSVSSVNDDFFSFGILGYYDKAGSINQQILSFYPAVNYNKSLSGEHSTYISVGFTGGYMQYSFDPSKATFNNQYLNNSFSAANPTGEQLPNPRLSAWDLGAGFNFNTTTGENNTTSYIIGVSGYHFSQPNTSYYKLLDGRMNMRFNVNGAFSTQLSENYTLQVHANYAHQGSYQETIGGVMFGWNKESMGTEQIFTLSAGVFYRLQDAIIPTIKVHYKGISYAVSYDVNVSTLKEASNLQGGYEISIYKTGFFKDKSSGKSKTFCPVFY